MSKRDLGILVLALAVALGAGVWIFLGSAMVGCLAAVYLCGSWWFSVYAGTHILSAMTVSVLPWLIPDALKLAMANHVAKRISKSLRIMS